MLQSENKHSKLLIALSIAHEHIFFVFLTTTRPNDSFHVAQ